jgi:hypothetical protein
MKGDRTEITEYCRIEKPQDESTEKSKEAALEGRGKGKK